MIPDYLFPNKVKKEKLEQECQNQVDISLTKHKLHNQVDSPFLMSLNI